MSETVTHYTDREGSTLCGAQKWITNSLKDVDCPKCQSMIKAVIHRNWVRTDRQIIEQYLDDKALYLHDLIDDAPQAVGDLSDSQIGVLIELIDEDRQRDICDGEETTY